MYIIFLPSFYSKLRDIRNIKYIKLYCFHGHMSTNTCLVNDPTRSLYLWSKCSGYMLPKKDISWGIFWTMSYTFKRSVFLTCCWLQSGKPWTHLLIGVSKAEFDDFMLYIDYHDLRDTATRSTSTCLAIFLLKLRCGLSNKLIATLFAMKKHQVNTFHPFTLSEF